MTAEAAALRALEALPHAMVVVDGADRLVLANAAFWRDAGAEANRFPPGTPLANLFRLMAFRGLLGPGDPVRLASEALAFDRARSSRRSQRSADGTRINEVSILPLAQGGFAMLLVDITAFDRAEATLRERTTLLERALNGQRGGIALFDEAQRLVLHNPAYRRHSGASVEMLAGKPTLHEVLAALDSAGEFLTSRDREHLRSALAADRRRPRTAQRERPDGTVVRYLSTPQPDGGFLIESEDVTDLSRAEHDAGRRAAILDGVLEALPQGVCVWGPDSRVAMFNTAYTRLMEGAPLQVGDTLWDVIRRRAEAGEYGAGEAEALYAREMARDLSQPQARRRLRANGTALDVRTAPLPDGGHISVITDITELWHAEEEARRRAQLVETAMASMRHGLVIFGPDHRVVASNELAARLAGHEPGEVWPGRSIGDLIRAQHAHGGLGPEPQATRIVEAALALDRTKPHRSVRETPDGRVIEVASDPTPDGGFIITHVDITAVARAEAEAKARAAILQVMLENMRHGICLFDADGRVVAANALAAAMTGLPADGFRPGRHILELRSDQIGGGVYGAPEDARRILGDRWDIPLRAPDRYTRRRPDGRIIEVTTDRTPDGGFVRTYNDVTEDRRIRDELELARSAAEAASAAKSRFLATMSHELRTPLSAVIGFAEALLTDPRPAEVTEYATAVHDAGRQLLSLIEDILDVASAGGPAPPPPAVPVDAEAVLQDVAAAIRPAAEAGGLTLTTEAARDLPALACDSRRLRRVLRALLDNAVKFTPAGGRLNLSVGPDGEGGVVFHISDTGIGMAPDDIPRAFEPFTQLDSALSRRFGGSGLGLHLARLLAEAMGGSLALTSAPGQGTIATLRLPREITISQAVPQEIP
ncbi:PAS domain-containing protein [Roseomonas sp. JC162]|uniref:histidine kinase n=1 Tax=Neoroseomonas marina TaxID=1232220 RepID=A0A848E7B8_9PROT|nr:PAS domain-containing sensor histidine kinase [Neoroseomonas marina]NMJ40311.1 PAS domain-containing protein [Neoroseomonas marina]